MADYDRRNGSSRGGFNNRKRRYRGNNPEIPKPSLKLKLKLDQMTTILTVGPSEEDLKNHCMSKCENNYLLLLNLYVYCKTRIRHDANFTSR